MLLSSSLHASWKDPFDPKLKGRNVEPDKFRLMLQDAEEGFFAVHQPMSQRVAGRWHPITSAAHHEPNDPEFRGNLHLCWRDTVLCKWLVQSMTERMPVNRSKKYSIVNHKSSEATFRFLEQLMFFLNSDNQLCQSTSWHGEIFRWIYQSNNWIAGPLNHLWITSQRRASTSGCCIERPWYPQASGTQCLRGRIPSAQETLQCQPPLPAACHLRRWKMGVVRGSGSNIKCHRLLDQEQKTSWNFHTYLYCSGDSSHLRVQVRQI